MRVVKTHKCFGGQVEKIRRVRIVGRGRASPRSDLTITATTSSQPSSRTTCAFMRIICADPDKCVEYGKIDLS
jgi:hypothetical protein